MLSTYMNNKYYKKPESDNTCLLLKNNNDMNKIFSFDTYNDDRYTPIASWVNKRASRCSRCSTVSYIFMVGI